MVTLTKLAAETPAPAAPRLLERRFSDASRAMQQYASCNIREVAFDPHWIAIAADVNRCASALGEFDVEFGAGQSETSFLSSLLSAALVDEFTALLTQAFPGLALRIFATRRRWSEKPLFHVDTSAFTVIAPLVCAPTLYSAQALPSVTSGFAPIGLPLGMRTVAAPFPDGKISQSRQDAFLLLKGNGWRENHRPLVHSPPAIVGGAGSMLNIATALIAELR